ncbi:hypothetical protein AC477_01045 [miscellaneous Crenarchaeota group-1 archaeon SG8-32-1]|uniref:Uncharacterized protein n=1 Tax=miscellaneous Crenarchaeota group-1 archaeon SG8-32-1 TaxID=1685124 RepID=A0A0M0C0D9_9ARCH|nr:MAG: hypothetical protein AC477_01045 [miscellaneous Crenarchaeota group-1 archaeon SG8-32-1]
MKKCKKNIKQKRKFHILELITPDLSKKVCGIGGTVIETEFPKCVKYAKLIIEQMKVLDRNRF